MNRYIVCILISILLSISSCSNVNNNEDMIRFMNSKVYIPTEYLDVRSCSSFSDSITSNDEMRIVVLFSESECTKCKMKELSLIVQKTIENYNQITIIYIVPCQKNIMDNVYALFDDFKIKGTIYLDTCNAFLSANPQIPDNELFHTFVINKEGKVLMVGNPFQNEKMEALFKKVIVNEQRKHKTKKV